MNIEAEEKDKNFRAVGLLSDNKLDEPQYNSWKSRDSNT